MPHAIMTNSPRDYDDARQPNRSERADTDNDNATDDRITHHIRQVRNEDIQRSTAMVHGARRRAASATESAERALRHAQEAAEQAASIRRIVEDLKSGKSD